MQLDAATVLRDPARLEVLRHTTLLDSPPEEAFDRLTRLASQLIQAPTSLVSLVDAHREFFKSFVGLSEPWASLRQAPLSHSFCQHAVGAGQPLIIEDARLHPLLHDNPAIRDLGVVAYAGVPLVSSSGHVLGAFCVIDHQPRVWTSDELNILRALGASASAEIELRLAAKDLRTRAEEALEQQYRAIVEVLEEGIVLADASGVILSCNASAERILGLPAADIRGRALFDPAWRAIKEDGTPFPQGNTPAMVTLRTGKPQSHVVLGLPGAAGEIRWLSSSSRPMFRAGESRPYAVVISFADFTERKETQEQLQRYARRLEQVHCLDQAILATDSPGSIARTVLEHLRQMVRYDRAMVLELDIEAGQAAVIACVGTGDRECSTGEAIPLYLLANANLLEEQSDQEPGRIVGDVSTLAALDTWWQYLWEWGTRSYMQIRLVAQEETIGLLMLESRQAGAFTTEHLASAREVGGPLAVALSQARLWEMLRASERLQGELLEQVIRAQEDERKRVARELHDDIGQTLTALAMRLGVVHETMLYEPGRAQSILEATLQLLDDMMSGVRRIMADLRPLILDDLGLDAALRRLGDDIQERAGLVVSVDTGQMTSRLSPDLEIVLFRIAQEALNNVCKHARAERVTITLTIERRRVIMKIQDDGVGFDMGTVRAAWQREGSGSGHFGLLGMKERAALANGRFHVMTGPQQGTTVRVELPLAAKDPAIQLTG